MNNVFKNILSIATVACFAVGFAACNSDNDEDQTTTQSVSDAYCIAVDRATGEASYCGTVSYTIDYNYTKYTSGVTITGLTLPDGMVYSTFSVTDMPFKYNSDGWKISTASSVNPASSYVSPLQDFSMQLLDRIYSNTYVPGFSVSFTLDDYQVYSSTTPFILGGTTVSTPASGDAYSTEETTYTVALDFDAMTACITITNARFHIRMPEGLVMDFKDIPFTINADGTFALSSAEVIPYIADVPYDKSYPISDLTATVSPTAGMNLQFTCTVFSQPFAVKANVGF